MEADRESWCCYPGCGKDATHWVGTDDVDHYTHACRGHVKDLAEPGDAVFPLRPERVTE